MIHILASVMLGLFNERRENAEGRVESQVSRSRSCRFSEKFWDSMLGATFKADTITGVYVEILHNFKTVNFKDTSTKSSHR